MWRCSSFLSSLVRPLNRRIHPQLAWNRFEFAQHFVTTEILSTANEGVFSKRTSPFIAFVLGGPGSGKGTQCMMIADAFKFTHLSAGDLLRKEMVSDGENGAMIRNSIKEGKIVPSEITIRLIQKAIESSENYKFLIDGFPRSDENRIAFERIVGVEPDLVLFFECPEEEMIKRVLSRNQGRIDDNIETVKKRLQVFHTLNLPVVNYYSRKGKVHKINAVGTLDEIFEKVRPLFAAFRMGRGIDSEQARGEFLSQF
ncbi:Adenylate kinase/UMP-CMP kinase protein [Dioscorea alata]|uniref:Adenylate kinase/UMP-CMP kinase protein n=1 Tax=Dioscorea alata TaxID=55571 RepID=A0ACB7WH03_DIOAL|nr:Adenylate kinase/UMP-CMP kinase protein [Dioscorea alata]